MTTKDYRRIERISAAGVMITGVAAILLGIITWYVPLLGHTVWPFVVFAVAGVLALLRWAAADMAASDNNTSTGQRP